MQKIKIKIVNGIIIFDANLDGIEGNLIIDTGSVYSTFNSNYFANHKNCIIQEKDVCIIKDGHPITQKYKVGKITIDKLTFCDYAFTNYGASLLDLNYVEKPLKSLDPTTKVLGTLGMDFISKHIVTINYVEEYLEIDSTANIEGKKYNLDFSTIKHPLVKTEINAETYTFILDTGASNCVCDNKYLESFSKEKAAANSQHFVAKDLRVFDTVYSNLDMVHIDMTRIANGSDIAGIIGFPCLKKSVLTLDCPNNCLFFKE